MATVDELIRQLESEYAQNRMLAAYELGDHHDPRAIDALIQTLEDQSVDCVTRVEAARSLGRIGDPKAIEPLIRTMEEEWGMCATSLRNAISEVLGAFRDPRVTNALVKALGSDYNTAHAAAESLKKLRDRRAVEPLIRRLEDQQRGGYHREFAAQILGVLGDPRAIPALVKALRDVSVFLRHKALESLRGFILTHPDAILRLDSEDSNFLARQIQEKEHDALLDEICK